MTGRRVAPAVVLGVGNILMSDDGVGVRVVEALRALAAHDPYALPEGVQLIDGGTLGLDLLRTVEQARVLLVVDAVDLGHPAGTVSVLCGDAILAAGGAWGRSAPGGVGELLSIARMMGWLPESVILVGIQVEDTAFGSTLTAKVAAAVPVAVALVRDELRGLDALVAREWARQAATQATEGATA